MRFRDQVVREWNERKILRNKTILGVFSVEEFNEAMEYSYEQGIGKIKLGRHYINKTDKLRRIYRKSFKCDVCGVEGEFFLLVHIKGKRGSISLELCTMVPDDGNHAPWRYMTVDHTIPKFLPEGNDVIENVQILCNRCNNEWKNKIDTLYWTDEVRKKFFGLG